MDVTSTVIQLGAFITALTIITKVLKAQISKEFVESNKKITDMDYNNCKTYLTDFLSDKKIGTPKSDIQRQRACEIYCHYKNDLKGNTYIQTEWENLM